MKGKFTLFQMLVSGRRCWTFIRSPTAPCKQRVRAFLDRMVGGGALPVEIQSTLMVILKIDHRWSGQHHHDCFRYS